MGSILSLLSVTRWVLLGLSDWVDGKVRVREEKEGRERREMTREKDIREETVYESYDVMSVFNYHVSYLTANLTVVSCHGLK